MLSNFSYQRQCHRSLFFWSSSPIVLAGPTLKSPNGESPRVPENFELIGQSSLQCGLPGDGNRRAPPAAVRNGKRSTVSTPHLAYAHRQASGKIWVRVLTISDSLFATGLVSYRLSSVQVRRFIQSCQPPHDSRPVCSETLLATPSRLLPSKRHLLRFTMTLTFVGLPGLSTFAAGRRLSSSTSDRCETWRPSRLETNRIPRRRALNCAMTQDGPANSTRIGESATATEVGGEGEVGVTVNYRSYDGSTFVLEYTAGEAEKPVRVIVDPWLQGEVRSCNPKTYICCRTPCPLVFPFH